MSPNDVLKQLKATGKGSLADRIGLEFISASVDEIGYATVSARLPVEGNTQPFGLLHGGANAMLAETVGSVASNITAQSLLGEGHITVGLDLNCTHHKSVRSGHVVGVARVISAGKTVITTHIDITDGESRLICTARLSCVVLKPRENGVKQ